MAARKATPKVWIRNPYDRGFAHALIVGKDIAVINAEAAEALHNLYGIPLGNDASIAIPIPALSGLDSVKLSKKARSLLQPHVP